MTVEVKKEEYKKKTLLYMYGFQVGFIPFLVTAKKRDFSKLTWKWFFFLQVFWTAISEFLGAFCNMPVFKERFL